MPVFVEMEYFSGKYMRDVKYNGYIGNMPEFGFLLERHAIEPEDIKRLSLDGKEQDQAEAVAMALKARGLLNGL